MSSGRERTKCEYVHRPLGPMDVLTMILVALAGAASVLLALVGLPKLLEMHGDLPYDSVGSRLVAWSAFAALMVAIASLAGGLGWNATMWAAALLFLGFAALWDVYDLITRRIPRGRRPDS